MISSSPNMADSEPKKRRYAKVTFISNSQQWLKLTNSKRLAIHATIAKLRAIGGHRHVQTAGTVAELARSHAGEAARSMRRDHAWKTS